MKLSENTVREIADWLQCGLECWVHKVRGTMIFLPNSDDPYYDPEMWDDAFVDVAGREQEYLVFETMDSSHSYRIMEDFTFNLASCELKYELERALQGPKPFQRFKQSVERSNLRESWYNYKFDAHMDWVKSQVNCHQLVG
ncbi:MAG: hypothetical protein AAGC47_10535 [Bacteroidota bacterium]